MGILNWPATLLLVGVLALGAMSCGDDDEGGEDQAAVEQSFRDAVAAWNAQDVDGLIAHFTDAGLVNSFGDGEETREDIVMFLPEFIGDPPLEIQELQIDVSGDKATADVLWAAGNALEHIEFTLVDEASVWKIDNEEDLAVEVPDGTTVVDVQMNEFAFALIASDITNGNVAFAAENVGEQDHEFALARIPTDAVIEELLMTEEDVPGFEFIGGVGPAEPGDTVNLVLTEALTPGRYLVVCFLPDTDDPEETPHAFKGMTAEFTIAP
jgi:hypothetical protein